jgi:hypothetical protein
MCVFAISIFMVSGSLYEGAKNAITDDYIGASCGGSAVCEPIDLRNLTTWFMIYLLAMGAYILFSWGIKPLMKKSNNQKKEEL